MGSAIRQRTRWVTGIALQSWEHHGWRGTLSQKYWFWRDRKGLFGNPLSLFDQSPLPYGLLSWMGARLGGVPWRLAQQAMHPWLLAGTLAIQAIQTAVRIGCARRLYGVSSPWASRCARCAPIGSIPSRPSRRLSLFSRAPLARALNLAQNRACLSLPQRAAEHKRRWARYWPAPVMQRRPMSAARSKPYRRECAWENIWSARQAQRRRSVRSAQPAAQPAAGRIEPWVINRNVARSLPKHVVRDWQVLPFRVSSGHLFLASPEIPSDEMTRMLRGFTRLSLRFHLITPQISKSWRKRSSKRPPDY